MSPATATPTPHVLDENLLTRCGDRAPSYDRDNRFFTEDFEELRDAGYLLLAVPKELGGLGLSLAEVCLEQRRLAYHAGPTAIAVNMHLHWTGVADAFLTREIVAKTALGLDFDEQPRWG